MLTKIAKAFFDRIKTRLGSKQGKPRRPDMSRHQEPFRCLFQQDFQQIPGIEPEDGTAVGGNVADGGQGRIHLLSRSKIRDIQQIMHLADLAAALIDRADLGTEHKTDSLW